MAALLASDGDDVDTRPRATYLACWTTLAGSWSDHRPPEGDKR